MNNKNIERNVGFLENLKDFLEENDYNLFTKFLQYSSMDLTLIQSVFVGGYFPIYKATTTLTLNYVFNDMALSAFEIPTIYTDKQIYKTFTQAVMQFEKNFLNRDFERFEATHFPKIDIL